jgi:hypothetical protein
MAHEGCKKARHAHFAEVDESATKDMIASNRGNDTWTPSDQLLEFWKGQVTLYKTDSALLDKFRE